MGQVWESSSIRQVKVVRVSGPKTSRDGQRQGNDNQSLDYDESDQLQ
jgi:hypothetical protein